MRRKKPIVVADLLSLFVKENNLESGFRQYRFLKLWDETLGRNISRATIGKRLEGTRLYVYLSSSVVRAELYMHRSEIIKELNRRMGEDVINEIILK